MNGNIKLEEALQRASAGLRRKMLYSIELLRKAEKIAMNYDKDDGFFLAFSGGKDSQALYHIAELGVCKIQSSHEPDERGPARGYPFCEEILSRCGVGKAEGVYLQYRHPQKDSAHDEGKMVLR